MKTFALLLLAGLPVCATITNVRQNTPADVTGTGQAYTVVATAAGNLMAFAFNFRSNATNIITSVTNTAGDSCVTANQRSSNATDARATEIWYCGNLTAGVTTFTINQNGAGVISVVGYEYHSSIGLLYLDTGSKTTNAAGAAFVATGGAFTTGAGTNDVIFAFCAGATVTTFTAVAPLVNAGQDGHGNQLAVALNQAAATYTPAFNVDTATPPFNLSVAAFRDTNPVGGAKVKHKAVLN